MLTSADKIEEQLRCRVDAAVRDAHLILAHAHLPKGMTVRPASHGYIYRELRFEANGRWLYSAVLNQKWILWYFRRPAIKTGLVEADATAAHFPEATATSAGDMKVRLHGAEQVRTVLQWIGAQEAPSQSDRTG